MKKQTFSILFLTKPNKVLRSGETPIIMRLTLTGKRIEVQLKRRITPKNWSQAKEKAIGRDTISIEINKYLDSVRTRIYQIEREIEDENLPITLNEIKDRFEGKKSKANNCKMLFEEFQNEIDRMESLIGIDFNKITVSRYKLCLKYFKEMHSENAKTLDIPIRDLNNSIIRQFEAFLKTERKLAHNTVIRFMKCLKKITNMAIGNGWITKNPFYSIKFKEKEVIKETLTIQEVMKIYNKNFDLPRLERTRDVFVFCCFTGLAFVDVHNLNENDFITDGEGNKWIYKQRTKTEVYANVPLTEIPLALLEKYKNNEECVSAGKLLPVYENQPMNSYLKEIAVCCGIKKNLTTHTARHTFATIMVSNRAALTNVAKMLGHTSTRMTERYARAQSDSIFQDMLEVHKNLAINQ